MTATRQQDKSPVQPLLGVPGDGGPPQRQSWLRRVLRRVPWKYVGPLLSIGLFAGAIIVLASILHDVDGGTVVAAFTSTPASAVMLSILFTGLSYLALTGYDGLALRQIGAENIPYSTAAIGSFTSYAISYTLGLPLLTAGTVRYRVYGGAGLTAAQIAALTLVCTLTFWLGMGAVLAAGLMIVPGAVSGINRLPHSLNILIGVAIVAAILAYVAYVSTRRRVVTVEGWAMPLPGGKVTLAQILLGALDVFAGAAALYVLLPGDVPQPFFTFVVIYVLAAILGVASHAPGGIGVFEATMLIALPSIPSNQLLASILLFRVIYYFIPFALALATLGIYELARRRHTVNRMVDQASGIMKAVTPMMASGLVLISGATMIVTGAIPLGITRKALLVLFVPLWTIEVAHIVGSLTGVALLFLARGLIRRAQGAWYAASLMMAIAILMVMLRSADYRLALALFAGFVVLLLSRPAFTRDVPFYGQEFSWVSVATVGTVLAFATWLGFFSFRYVDYSASLWFEFGYESEMSRFLRSTLIASLAAMLIVAVNLLRLRRHDVPAATGIQAPALAALSGRSISRLAALPEFRTTSDDSGEAALMWSASGTSNIALGDPVGALPRVQDLIFSFTEQTDKDRRWTVFVDVAPGMLPAYREAGFAATPVGETLWIDLPRLGTEAFMGSNSVIARADAVGLSVDLVPGTALAPLMPQFAAIAEAWRANAAGDTDGHFTIGRFMPEWLQANDCAILRRAGEVVGFAVVLRADPDEWSLDIVRYLPDVAELALDYILLRVMRLAKARGVARFSLGLTPTPMLVSDSLGPNWQRMTPLFFAYGEQFPDHVSLRAFKDRFAPQREPRYLTTNAGFALPHTLVDLDALVEKGPQPTANRGTLQS